MKPTLEQIKTDESVWPNNSTYWVDGVFKKWVDGKEYTWSPELREWLREDMNWHIGRYRKNGGYSIIPRPTKAFVPEVGVECEYWLKRDEDAVFKCEPKYVSEKMVVANCFIKGRTIEQALQYHEAGFRPIKSEREKLVDFLLLSIDKGLSSKDIAEGLSEVFLPKYAEEGKESMR